MATSTNTHTYVALDPSQCDASGPSSPVGERPTRHLRVLLGGIVVACVIAGVVLCYEGKPVVAGEDGGNAEGTKMLWFGSRVLRQGEPANLDAVPTRDYQMDLRIALADANREAMRGDKILPHGGKLVDRMVKGSGEAEMLVSSCDMFVTLTDRQLADVELLINGGFSPLEGFMDQETYESVLESKRLPGGELWGLPVVLDTDDVSVQPGKRVGLLQGTSVIAVMDVGSRYTPDKVNECVKSYGVTTLEHPGCLMVATERGADYVSGKVTGIELPHRVFPCKTPAQVRASLPSNTDIVAFQCRNPIHRAHYELFTRALDADNVKPDAMVLVHPTVGPTQADDISGLVRYKTYEVLKEETNNPRIAWEYLPYSMHMAGPREALQHMLIRKNYGCTHFIIGRDMAGSKSSITGEDFYGAYDAQDLAKSIAPELMMQTVPSLNLVYTEEKGYVTADEAKSEGLTIKKLSGTKFRQMLRAGDDIPEWFAFKSVVAVLREG